MIKVMTDRVRCIYCGEEFEWNVPHPPSIRMINGYPAPCEYVGKSNVGIINPDELPFSRVVTEERPDYGMSIVEKAIRDNIARTFGVPLELFNHE